MANYVLAPLAVVLASVVAGVAAQPPYSDVNELGLDINGAWECPCLTRQHPGVEEVSKPLCTGLIYSVLNQYRSFAIMAVPASH